MWLRLAVELDLISHTAADIRLLIANLLHEFGLSAIGELSDAHWERRKRRLRLAGLVLRSNAELVLGVVVQVVERHFGVRNGVCERLAPMLGAGFTFLNDITSDFASTVARWWCP